MEPIVAGAKVALECAGSLVEQTIRQARANGARAETFSIPACLKEIIALLESTWERDILFDLEIGSNVPAEAISGPKPRHTAAVVA
jgi:hypothetical protein